MGAIEETEIVADIVGKDRLQPCPDNRPMGVRGHILGLDQHGGRHVAENEMTVAIAPVEMPRADFRTDHQHRPRIARTDKIRCGLDAEGRRRAGNIHVEGKALDPQRLLDFDRHGRIRPLQIGRCAEHRIDIPGIPPSPRQCVLRRRHADLGQNRDFVVGPFGPAGRHDLRIEQRRLAHDVPGFDPARLLDEFDRAGQQFGHFACRNPSSIGRIEACDIAVEAVHQLHVGDRFRRSEQPCSGDYGDEFGHEQGLPRHTQIGKG